MPAPLNLSGRKFTRLTVVRRIGCDSRGNALWLCKCECGQQVNVPSNSLTSKNTQSCGCLQTESQKKHGCWKHPLFKIWGEMMRRCYSEKHVQYPDYGGRGIKVFLPWHDPAKFIADMPPRPSKRHSLDRYPNNNGNYEPGNVRWATQSQQCRNTRRNKIIKYRGESRCLREWSEVLNMSYKTLFRRLAAGWSVERAFTSPIITPRRKSR